MNCAKCGIAVYECMFFTSLTDYLKAMEGIITFDEVRVLCEKCLDNKPKLRKEHSNEDSKSIISTTE